MDKETSTLDVVANNEDAWGLDSLMRLKGQAFEVWNEIE